MSNITTIYVKNLTDKNLHIELRAEGCIEAYIILRPNMTDSISCFKTPLEIDLYSNNNLIKENARHSQTIKITD